MTEEEQAKIEELRWRLAEHDEAAMHILNTYFPEPKPKDPIEECRAELEEYMRTHQLGATRATAIHALDIYDKHFPKKETT